MNRGLLYILLVLAMVGWGESWISAKILTRYAPPEVLVFWRFFITWVSFAPVMIAMKKTFRISGRGLLTSILAATLMVLYNEMFFIGLRYGLAGAGGVLVPTLIPLLTFILGCTFTMTPPSVKDSFGLILGAIGVGVIMKIWQTDLSSLFASGNIYFLTAALIWAFLTHTSRMGGKFDSAFTFSFYMFFFTSVLILPVIYTKGMTILFPFDMLFTANLLLLAAGATTFGTTVYFIATTYLGSSRASSFVFLVPLNAVLMSWLFLKEPIHLNTVIGGIASVTAVYIINYRRKRA